MTPLLKLYLVGMALYLPLVILQGVLRVRAAWGQFRKRRCACCGGPVPPPRVTIRIVAVLAGLAVTLAGAWPLILPLDLGYVVYLRLQNSKEVG